VKGYGFSRAVRRCLKFVIPNPASAGEESAVVTNLPKADSSEINLLGMTKIYKVFRDGIASHLKGETKSTFSRCRPGEFER
jgi:hypothetical protein